MAEQAYTPRLKAEYQERIRAAMKEKFGYTNEMQIPKIDKIVVNMGIGEAVADSKKAAAAMKDLALITGQKPQPTKARLSVATFKLREGMVIGAKVTLRGDPHVVILLDGRPSIDLSAGWRALALQRMPASAIESIEVITGVSAQFPSDGAGVINIVTRKAGTKARD